MAIELAPTDKCDRCSFMNKLVDAARSALKALPLKSKLTRANAVRELSEALKEFDQTVENYDVVQSIRNEQYETSRTN